MYNYQTEKEKIFTEQGQIIFLAIRDNMQKLLSQSGAAMMKHVCNGINGDTFLHHACVDRLIELKEIREIERDCAGQHRVFIPIPSKM